MTSINRLPQEEQDRTMMALHRLKRNRDFKHLITLLEFSLTQTDLVLREADGHQLYRHQGRSQALSEVLKLITESSDYIRIRKAGME